MALFAVCGLRAQDARSQTASGAQREWLSSFSSIVIDAPLDIRLIRVDETQAPRIVYDTKGSSSSKFKAAVKDRTLRITERPVSGRAERTEVTVYYNELHKIAATDATVSAADTLRGVLFDMEVGGGAKITASLAVDDLSLEMSGKSDVTLTGESRYLTAYVSNGRFDASKLKTLSAQVNAQNGADVSLWVTDRLEARTSTNGSVTFTGDPRVIRGGSKFMGGAIRQMKTDVEE